MNQIGLSREAGEAVLLRFIVLVLELYDTVIDRDSLILTDYFIREKLVEITRRFISEVDSAECVEKSLEGFLVGALDSFAVAARRS